MHPHLAMQPRHHLTHLTHYSLPLLLLILPAPSSKLFLLPFSGPPSSCYYCPLDSLLLDLISTPWEVAAEEQEPEQGSRTHQSLGKSKHLSFFSFDHLEASLSQSENVCDVWDTSLSCTDCTVYSVHFREEGIPPRNVSLEDQEISRWRGFRTLGLERLLEGSLYCLRVVYWKI